MLLTKAGEKIPIKLNASIIYDGKEELATIGFFHDLRDDLQIQRKLEDTQMQLLQAEKMASLGKLAAGVAHQVNNPLNSITLFTRLVLDEYELQNEAVSDLKRVLFAAERCKDIIKELLEFARQTNQDIMPLDINKAILRTLFLLEDQTLFHNIEIEKSLSELLPLVPLDRRQINHVFMNLILNASEAIGEENGTIFLTTGKMYCSQAFLHGTYLADDLNGKFNHLMEARPKPKITSLIELIEQARKRNS